MAVEENRFVTYIIPPFPVQERILRNKRGKILDFLATISYPTRARGVARKQAQVGAQARAE